MYSSIKRPFDSFIHHTTIRFVHPSHDHPIHPSITPPSDSSIPSSNIHSSTTRLSDFSLASIHRTSNPIRRSISFRNHSSISQPPDLGLPCVQVNCWLAYAEGGRFAQLVLPPGMDGQALMKLDMGGISTMCEGLMLREARQGKIYGW